MICIIPWKVLLFSLCIFFLTPFVLFAQSSSGKTIVIQQQIGTEANPPTTPAFITATPVATTQIDVAWGSSTDDVSLAGYRLRRDGVYIATTTLTTYSDTGLTPSTTYSYVVEAYDWTNNISTSTGPVATTTYQVVVPTTSTTTPETSGGNIHPRMVSFEVDPTTSGAVFTWSTNIYTNYVLRWGLGGNYELGFVQSDTYKRTHSTQIGGLQPDTTYQFELVGYNQRGEMFVLKRDSFTTNAFPDATAPANVSNMQAVVQGVSVAVSWHNPTDDDFAKVRVLRNPLFYPQDPTDGIIVYEGHLESLLDSGVLSGYDTQYYTIFSYDTVGNVSSGAIGLAQKTGIDPYPNTENQPANGTDVGTATSSTVVDLELSEAISFGDVVFTQDGFVLAHSQDNVAVGDDMPITISLASDLLPKHLKTVTVTLRKGSLAPQSYILRANKSRTAYQARIALLPEGVYNTTFAVYDFTLQTEMVFGGEIISAPYTDDTSVTPPAIIGWTGSDLLFTYRVSFVVFILFMIWWWLFALRRSREDN